MKKKLILLFLALLTAVAGYCIYQETHFGTSTFVPANLSQTQILREMPDLASETDEALRQTILALPQVQAALNSTSPDDPLDFQHIPFASVQAQLEPYLPKDWTEPMEFAVANGNTIYFSLHCGPEKTVNYHFFADGSYPTDKGIALYRFNHRGQRKSMVLYTNNGTTLQKQVEKHLWFAWLYSDN